jgi:hypothetical protein
MSENKEEDLREVKVQVALCSKCGGNVLMAVKKSMDKSSIKDFAKLTEIGCDIQTTNVIVARTIKWCELPCWGMWNQRKPKKIRGYKEGIITQDLISGYGNGFKKGDVVRYRRYKSLADADGFRTSEYEFHYLDENNQNLVRSTRLLIEGEEPLDYYAEYLKKRKKYE